MREFDVVMGEILAFTGTAMSDPMRNAIAAQAERQRSHQSRHAYSLARFGLDETTIRRDCAFLYETFDL